MAESDDSLFADLLMNQKFRLITEILEQFVTNPSQDLSITHLAEYTGCTSREVTQICKKLELAGLVKPSKESSKVWMLICDPSTITLEDVYRSMINNQEYNDDIPPASEQLRNIDLLIMQATMEVNQSIFKHLRQFSLGRPKNSHFSG